MVKSFQRLCHMYMGYWYIIWKINTFAHNVTPFLCTQCLYGWKFYAKSTFFFNIFSGDLHFDTFPMDTSLSIRHRFGDEIPHGKFVEISSILKGESEIMTSIRRGNFDVDSTFKIDKIWISFPLVFSMLFWRRIDVTSVLTVSILSFSNIFCSGSLLT